MIELKQCKLVLEKATSKNGNEYCALYLITEQDDKIFLTFVNKYVFDKLLK